MTKKTLLIIEPEISGHHIGYLKLTIDALFKKFNIVVGTLECHKEKIRKELSGKILKVVTIKDAKYVNLRGSGAFQMLNEQIEELALYKKLFIKASIHEDIDLVFIMFIDLVVVSLALSRKPFGEVEYSGISMNTWISSVYSNNAYRGSIKSNIKEWIFKLLLMSRKLYKIFHIDAILVEKIDQKYLLNGNILYLPDPILNYKECSRFKNDYVLDSNTVSVLIVGAITNRKGILPLAKEIIVNNLSNIKLLIFGEGVKANLCKETKYYLEILNNRGQLSVIDKRISEKDLQNAYCMSDWVWAAYNNHIGSSGIFLHATAYRKPTIVKNFTNSGMRAIKLNSSLLVSEEYSNLSEILTEYVNRKNSYTVPKESASLIIREHSVDNFSQTILKALI